MDNRYEDEVNLVTILFKVCQRWRVLLIVTALSAVAIGGAKLTLNILQFHNAGNRAESDAEYRDTLNGYEESLKELGQKIADRQEELRIQTEYNEKSMLMKVDPYNEWAGSMTLYIDADYREDARNENPAYKIVFAYYAYYADGFYADVMDRLSFDMEELKYLKEALGVSVDTNRYSISINAVADTKERCDEMLKAAGEAFLSRYGSIKSSLGEHSLTMSDAASGTRINMDREQYQAAQKSKTEEWSQDADKLAEEYRDLESRKSAAEDVSLKSAVKNGIKWIVLAAAAGCFLGFFVLFAKYLLSGRIKSAEDLGGDIYALAELPARGKKKNAVDRRICRLFGVTVKEAEYDSRLEAMALSLSKMLGARQCDKGTIAFVGDVEETELQAFAKQLGKTLPAGYRAVAAGDIIADPAAAKAAYEADAVVLAARQDVTMKKSYARIYNKLSVCKVEVLGAVLLGVESI